MYVDHILVLSDVRTMLWAKSTWGSALFCYFRTKLVMHYHRYIPSFLHSKWKITFPKYDLLSCPNSNPWFLLVGSYHMTGLQVVKQWSVEEVGTWLENLSLGEYREQFIRNDIRGSELLSLERRDLKVQILCLLSAQSCSNLEPPFTLTLKVPEKLQLYGLYVYYVVHICDFGMLRVNVEKGKCSHGQ